MRPEAHVQEQPLVQEELLKLPGDVQGIELTWTRYRPELKVPRVSSVGAEGTRLLDWFRSTTPPSPPPVVGVPVMVRLTR